MIERKLTLKEIREYSRQFYNSLPTSYFSPMGFMNQEDFANAFFAYINDNPELLK